MKALVSDYKDKGVAFVAIQPNDPKAVMLSELGYTDVSDSLDEMKIRAEYREAGASTPGVLPVPSSRNQQPLQLINHGERVRVRENLIHLE